MTNTLIDLVFHASDTVDDDDRTVSDILHYAYTEMGELAEEHIIEQGRSYKNAGPDGVVGEAMDAILCLLDIIHVHSPELTSVDLEHIAIHKINKWLDSKLP